MRENNKKGSISDNKAKFFTRGGQITLNNIRMFMQINRSIGQWCIWMTLLVTLATIWIIMPFDALSATYYYVAAKVLSAIYVKNHIFHMQWHGHTIFLSPSAILSEPYFKTQLNTFYTDTKLGLIFGVLVSIILMIWVTIWLTKRGRAQ